MFVLDVSVSEEEDQMGFHWTGQGPGGDRERRGGEEDQMEFHWTGRGPGGDRERRREEERRVTG